MEQRQVARKIRLIDIQEGNYVKVEGEWDPNYVETPDGRKFSRANIIAVVSTEPTIDMSYETFTLDDGTARVPVRIFGQSSVQVELGDVVLVIARPREFNEQIYLVPEIVKKIHDNDWIKLRKLELEQEGPDMYIERETEHTLEASPENNVEHVRAVEKASTGSEPVAEQEKPTEAIETGLTGSEQIKPSPEEETTSTVELKAEEVSGLQNPADQIINTIRRLDQGEGADTDEVLTAAEIKDGEAIINNLLKEGEIFEISNGKVKVLE